MIREAIIQDLYNEDLHVLGASFFAEANLPGVFISAIFVHNWTVFINQQFGAIHLLERDNKVVGAIAGVAHPDPYDGKMVAQEMFWFVNPGSRGNIDAIRLYDAFEKWAKAKKAKRIGMACVCNDKMGKLRKFYERKGFKPKEVNFFKQL